MPHPSPIRGTARRTVHGGKRPTPCKSDGSQEVVPFYIFDDRFTQTLSAQTVSLQSSLRPREQLVCLPSDPTLRAIRIPSSSRSQAPAPCTHGAGRGGVRAARAADTSPSETPRARRCSTACITTSARERQALRARGDRGWQRTRRDSLALRKRRSKQFVSVSVSLSAARVWLPHVHTAGAPPSVHASHALRGCESGMFG